jgi:carbonic anhydrase
MLAVISSLGGTKMRGCLVLIVMAAAVAVSSTVHAQTCKTDGLPTDFSYSATPPDSAGKPTNTEPKCWGQIASKKFVATCEQGFRQSPVVLSNAGTLTFAKSQSWAYRDVLLVVENTGHAIELPFRPGTTPATRMAWKIDGKDYILQQIHFHVPSEHMFKAGEPYAMEAHLVHKADDGALAVRAILFREGAANWMLQGALLRNLPKSGEDLSALVNSYKAKGIPVTKVGEGLSYTDVSINPTALIPSSSRFFQYSGSLTTPNKDAGCIEGVYWRVDETVMEAASNQIKDIKDALGGHGNNRPVQVIKQHKIERSD